MRLPGQLALGLREPSGWGGRRPGAGRKPAPDARILHRSREGFGARQACHVTLKMRPEVPSLRSVRLVRELECSFAKLRRRRDFRLVHYALQGDHAHLIVEAKDPEALGRGMKALGARLARAVNRTFRRKGARAGGSLPPARAAHAEGGAQRAGLRAAQRPAAREEGTGRCCAAIRRLRGAGSTAGGGGRRCVTRRRAFAARRWRGRGAGCSGWAGGATG